MPDVRNHDEWISGYVDGALDEAGMAEFERALAGDPALAAELARLLDNDTLLRKAFASPLEEPVDRALLERMGLTEPASRPVARPAAANDNPPFWRGWRIPAAAAVAAALALVVTVGMPSEPASGQFGPMLDATPSGQVAVLEDGTELTPVLSFAAADGRFCREFSITSGSDGGKGVACRNGAATWQVEAMEPGATRLASGAGIRLATGADSNALAAVYNRLGASDPLPLDREQNLIESGWTAAD